MTAEELSYASADQSNERMVHELQSTSRRSRPPRMDPPASSRESLGGVPSPPPRVASPPLVSAMKAAVPPPVPQGPLRQCLHQDPMTSVAATALMAFLLGYVTASLMSKPVYRGSTEPSAKRVIDRIMTFVS